MGTATAFRPRAMRKPARSATTAGDDLVRIVFAIEDEGQDLVAILLSHPLAGRPLGHRPAHGADPDAFYGATLADPDVGPAEGTPGVAHPRPREHRGAAPHRVTQQSMGRSSTISGMTASMVTSGPHEPSTPPDR